MTLQKSSINPFGYTFYSALKNYFYIPLLGMLVLILSVPVSALSSLRMEIKNVSFAEGSATDVINKASDVFKYYIMGSSSPESSMIADILCRIIIVAMSVFLAVQAFKFITNKKTVNVFYSLGITRKNLFASNFLACILMLSIAIVVPFLGSAIINTSMIGSSKELWTAILYYICNYISLAFVSFSVTVIVSSCVGTIAESFVFSTLTLLAPSLFLTSIEGLMDKFVLGAPYRGSLFYGSTITSASLLGDYSFFNPIMFGYKDCVAINVLSANTSATIAKVSPNFWIPIVWAAIAVGFFFLGMHTFQKRKAEICGFYGKSKIFNSIVIFILGFKAFCFTITIFNSNILLTTRTTLILGVLVGAIVYLAAYLIVTLAITRSFKQFLSGSKALLFHYGIVGIITLIFATGLLGYSSRIPNAEDVKTVRVTPVASNPIFGTNFQVTSEGLDFYLSYGGLSMTLESQNDIKKISALHKLIIDDGRVRLTDNTPLIPRKDQVICTTFSITYTLKNGKSIKRYYSQIRDETLVKLLDMNDTEYSDKLITELLTNPSSSMKDPNVLNNQAFYSNASFSIATKDFGANVQLKLDENKRADFLSSLAKDITDQTAAQRYMPTCKMLGTLQISIPSSHEQYYDDSNNPRDYPKDYPESPLPNDIIAQNDNAIKEKLPPINYNKSSYSSSVYLPITEDMKNVIKFLNENNIIELLNPIYEFESASVILSSPALSNPLENCTGNTLHFISPFSTQLNSNIGNHIFRDYFKNSVKVSDKNIVKQFADDGYSSYFNGVPGYFVRLETADKLASILFVRADKMPANIVKEVENLPEKDMDFFYINRQ